MPTPEETQEPFFKIENTDGTFDGHGSWRKGKKGKVWSKSGLKSHIRIYGRKSISQRKVIFDLGDPNAVVIEYETRIKSRTPIKEIIRKMHDESEKREKRHKQNKFTLVFEDEEESNGND
jgi:hypothetical protein